MEPVVSSITAAPTLRLRFFVTLMVVWNPALTFRIPPTLSVSLLFTALRRSLPIVIISSLPMVTRWFLRMFSAQSEPTVSV
jgi:hypothetical protein